MSSCRKSPVANVTALVANDVETRVAVAGLVMAAVADPIRALAGRSASVCAAVGRVASDGTAVLSPLAAAGAPRAAACSTQGNVAAAPVRSPRSFMPPGGVPVIVPALALYEETTSIGARGTVGP